MEYHRKDWGTGYAEKRDEIEAQVNSDFDKWDLNGDKAVTKDEMTIFWCKVYKEKPAMLNWIKF